MSKSFLRLIETLDIIDKSFRGMLMKILFQGDSITDTGRNTINGSLISIGQGYACMIDGILSTRYPGEYTFQNLGISGNRIVDLYARLKVDVWNQNPDILSLLIGVNDVWHDLNPSPNGVDAVRFYTIYDMLVHDTLQRFPNLKFVLMEPFVLKTSSTPENWDFINTEVTLRAKAVKDVAEKYNQVFVPLQSIFNDALKVMPSDYWLGDGVHPTPAGHQLIANQWIDSFEHLLRNPN